MSFFDDLPDAAPVVSPAPTPQLPMVAGTPSQSSFFDDLPTVSPARAALAAAGLEQDQVGPGTFVGGDQKGFASLGPQDTRGLIDRIGDSVTPSARFKDAVREGSGPVGALEDATALHFVPEGPQRDAMRQSIIDRREFGSPGFMAEPTLGGKIGAAATEVAGNVLGGLTNPLNFLGGPAEYEAVRTGATKVLPAVARAAGIQGLIQGGSDVAAQGVNLADGTQPGGFDAGQAAQAAAGGAVLGGVAPAAGGLVNAIVGKRFNLLDGLMSRGGNDGGAGFDGAAEQPQIPGPPQGPPPDAPATIAPGAPPPEPPAPVAPPTPEPPPAAAPVVQAAPAPAGLFDDLPSVRAPEPSAAPEPPAAEPSAPVVSPETAPPPPVAAPVAEPSAPVVSPETAPPPPAAAPVAGHFADLPDAPVPVPTPEPPTPPAVPPKPEAPSVSAEPAPPAAAPPAAVPPAAEASAPVVSPEPDTSTPASAPAPNATLAPPRSPLGGTIQPDHFNTETSPFRQVFADAGHDPNLMVNRPIREQNQVITNHIRDTFGFKDVTTGKLQDPKEIRDQFSNFYQNARDMANTLGMPYSGVGLNGRISLTSDTFRPKAGVLGLYYPGSQTIHMPGRSNSFAHEWGHALDHYLADQLTGSPKAMKLLSETAGAAVGRPGNKIPATGSSAEAFVDVMKSIFGGDAPTAAEALSMQYVAARPGADQARAKSRLAQIESTYGKQAQNYADRKYAAYMHQPAEMLARAHEAYVHEMIRRNGGDTRALTKSNHVAQTKNDAFDRAFPQDRDRTVIFHRMTMLFDALRREDLLGKGAAGPRPDGYDIVDPSTWARVADVKQNKPLTAAMRREAAAIKNFRGAFMDNLLARGADTSDEGPLTKRVRAEDAARMLTYSVRHVMGPIVARQPEGPARAAFQEIMDRLVPAVHMRENDNGRWLGQVFEEKVRHYSRENTGAMERILLKHGLDNMSDMEKLMLRHVMTGGTDRNFKSGDLRVSRVPKHIKAAAGDLRYVMDQEYERNVADALMGHNGGPPLNRDAEPLVDLGYARSGYFPRQYDDHKVFGASAEFQEAAEKLHTLMFNRDVTTPEDLLDAHDRLSRADQALLDPGTQTAIAELRKNLREQDQTATDPARRLVLEQDAQDILDQHKDEVGSVYANAAARDWRGRIVNGDPTSFDTRGPNASYTRKRVLPPETDDIMRDFLVTDPTIALPRYFQQSARKRAFAEHFGANGSKLDALFDQAEKNDARGEDIRTMRYLVESVTGKLKSGMPGQVERALNAVHAMGSMSLMGRAVFSSLAEPTAAALRTGKLSAAFNAFAMMAGDAIGAADAKDRAAIANAVGITISHLQDGILANRTEANYENSPRLQHWTTRYYQISGLTHLTNAQRRAAMGAGHEVLKAWSGDILDAGTSRRQIRRARDAAAEFRDLGVPDAQHENLARWITEHPGLPALSDLPTEGGQLWQTAITRLVDKIIQDPLRVDKPLLSQNPVGRLAFGLMGFNYASFQNLVTHRIDTDVSRVKEGYADARDAGASKVGAGVTGALPALGRVAAGTGAAVALMYVGSLIASTVREAMFNPTKFAEQREQGTLREYLSDLAISRTPINGPLDPVIQAFTGLKYQRDLSSLEGGAMVNYFLQAAADTAAPMIGAGSPDTNTALYKSIRGAYRLAGVPGMAVALSNLPGGPLTRAGYGAAMMVGTSTGAADKLATKLVGPKGSGPGGEPPTPPTPWDPDSGKPNPNQTRGGPIGLLDDVLVPAARAVGPFVSRLPGAAKVAGAAVAGGVAVSKLGHIFGRYKEGGGDGE